MSPYVLRTSIDKIKENGFELTKKRSRRYPAKTITDADYSDDIAILANTSDQAETLLHSLEQTDAGISLHVNAHKTEYKCFNKTGDISTIDRKLSETSRQVHLPRKQCLINRKRHRHAPNEGMDSYRYAIDHMEVRPDRSNETQFLPSGGRIDIERLQTLEKKLDNNYTRMLRAIWNKSWRQHPTMHQLYGHLPPITNTIQVRWTRHAGHCWRSRDELISDILLWTTTYSRAKAGRPAWTYIQQLCEDTECSPEDQPEAMNDRQKWRERVRDIRAGGTDDNDDLYKNGFGVK